MLPTAVAGQPREFVEAVTPEQHRRPYGTIKFRCDDFIPGPAPGIQERAQVIGGNERLISEHHEYRVSNVPETAYSSRDRGTQTVRIAIVADQEAAGRQARVRDCLPVVTDDESDVVAAYPGCRISRAANQRHAIYLDKLLGCTESGSAPRGEYESEDITFTGVHHDASILALLAENIGKEYLREGSLACN